MKKTRTFSDLVFMDYEELDSAIRIIFSYSCGQKGIKAFLNKYCSSKEGLYCEAIDGINIVVDIYSKDNFEVNAELIKDNGNIEEVETHEYSNNLIDFVDVVYRTESSLSKEAYAKVIKLIA